MPKCDFNKVALQLESLPKNQFGITRIKFELNIFCFVL